MKKILLFSALSALCLSTQAQESKTNATLNTPQAHPLSDAKAREVLEYSAATAKSPFAAKGTATVTSRWYNYGVFYDQSIQAGGNTTGLSSVIIWNDTMGRVNYSSGIANNNMVSVGSIFQPQAAGFNNLAYFNGQMLIDNSKAYTVDSIRLYADHNINPAKSSVVDTLILTSLKGANLFGTYYLGTFAAYGYDTLRCANIEYDSVINTAKASAGAPVVTIKVPITAAMWGDTLANGVFVAKVPVSISAAAGDVLAMSITFKSGDASFPAASPGDTIEKFNGTYKYNSYYPLVITKKVAGNTAYAQYIPGDVNEGLYKTLPSYLFGYSGQYVPMWSFTSGGGASYLQHIFMDWHVNCSNCGTVAVNDMVRNNIGATAFPNPADGRLHITFTQDNNAKATVSLINTLGQVVAEQQATAGKAEFNTTTMPAGIYIYSIAVNGEKVKGQVTITH